MAQELGVINYTNVNAGTAPVDRTHEARSLQEGLNFAKKVADEVISANVEQDMYDAISDVAAEGLSKPVTQMRDTPFEAGSVEEFTMNRIDKLNQVISQGSASQRTKAEMEIRKIMTQATKDYPWLRDSIARRANSVVAGSAQLMELGLGDELRGLKAKEAQDLKKGMYDYGVKSWKDGGLGIDRRIPQDSPLWAAQYTEANALRAQQDANLQIVEMAKARGAAAMTDPTVRRQLDEAIFGEKGLLTNSITGLEKDYGWRELTEELQKGVNADPALLQEWKVGKGPMMLEDLDRLKAQYLTEWNQMWAKSPEMLASEAGQQYQKLFEDQLAVFDVWKSSLQGVIDGVPGATTQIETILKTRAYVQYSRMPETAQAFTAFIGEDFGKNLMDLAAMPGNPFGLEIFHNLGKVMQGVLNPYVDEMITDKSGATIVGNAFNSTGALQLAPDASASDIEGAIKDRFLDPKNSWTWKAVTGEDNVVAALHNFRTHKEIYDYVLKAVPDQGPSFANESLLGMTYSLMHFNQNRNRPRDVYDLILDSLGDENTMHAVDAALKSPNPGRRQAFASAVAEFYANSDVDQRKEKARARYQSDLVGGRSAAQYGDKATSLSGLVMLDDSDMEEKGLVYTIKQEVFDAMVDERLARTAAPLESAYHKKTHRDRYARQLYKEIDEGMGSVLGEMNKQIRIERLMNKASAQDGKTLYPDTFTAFFDGVARPQAGDSWADIFFGSK